MKNIIYILAVLSILTGCTKEKLPEPEEGSITLYHGSQSRGYYVEVNDGEIITVQYHNGQGINCETPRATVISLPEGTHKIRVSTSGGCGNASGFTQQYYVESGSCKISRLSCGSTEL